MHKTNVAVYDIKAI
jgi:hypothetical protein